MKAFLCALCCLVMVSAPEILAQANESEAQIRALVAEQEAAWNRGDAEGYSAHFSNDGTFTNIRGTRFTGHAAFLARHVEIFTGFFRGSSLHSRVERIHFPTEGVAVVDIHHEVRGLKSFPPGVPATADGILRTMLLEVFVRREGRWELVAYHNVDLKPTRSP